MNGAVSCSLTERRRREIQLNWHHDIFVETRSGAEEEEKQNERERTKFAFEKRVARNCIQNANEIEAQKMPTAI